MAVVILAPRVGDGQTAVGRVIAGYAIGTDGGVHCGSDVGKGMAYQRVVHKVIDREGIGAVRVTGEQRFGLSILIEVLLPGAAVVGDIRAHGETLPLPSQLEAVGGGQEPHPVQFGDHHRLRGGGGLRESGR